MDNWRLRGVYTTSFCQLDAQIFQTRYICQCPNFQWPHKPENGMPINRHLDNSIITFFKSQLYCFFYTFLRMFGDSCSSWSLLRDARPFRLSRPVTIVNIVWQGKYGEGPLCLSASSAYSLEWRHNFLFCAESLNYVWETHTRTNLIVKRDGELANEKHCLWEPESGEGNG